MPTEQPDAPVDRPTSKCAFIGSDYINLPCEPETWLIKPLIPTGGAVVMYGEAKVGKSFAAIQLALAVQSGKDWLGFPVMSPGPVLYVQLDTPRGLWISRLKDLRQSGLTDVNELVFADRETLEAMPFSILNHDHFRKLSESVKAFRPQAVIVDTIREAHPGDENDSTDMRNVIAALAAATTPAAMILISHERKPSQDSTPSIISDLRGSNYVVGRMDCILRFTKQHLYYAGRAIEEGSVKMARTDNGLWVPAQAELDHYVAEVMSTEGTISDKAKALALRTGKSEEACRSLLRRALGRSGTRTPAPAGEGPHAR